MNLVMPFTILSMRSLAKACEARSSSMPGKLLPFPLSVFSSTLFKSLPKLCSCCLQSPLSVLQQPSWVTWRWKKIMTLHGTFKKNNRKVLTPSNHPWFHFRTPDTAKVRSKMLYASSKDALRRTLVGIAIEVQGTDLSEVRHLHSTGVSKGLAVPVQLRSPSHSFLYS